jgi:ATP-dependent helicase/DNAse subunit B
MTKPSERLILSTVEKQTDGSARTPSLAFSRVKFLLSKEDDVELFDNAAIERALNIPHVLQDADVLRLPPREAGITLRLSQSKIRTFALCPYSYYSSYQLHLREQKDSKPSYADDGNFLHAVFERFLRRAIDENGVFRLPDFEEIEPMAHEIADEYIAEVCPLSPEKTDKRLLHLFARLHKLAVVMLHDILGELHNTCFTPALFEQVIGGFGKNALPPVVIDLKNGSRVTLSGKIDRVDICNAENGRRYVRIVDYKTGVHEYDPDEVRSGMDIQPVLYLLAVIASNPNLYLPGGAQYLFHAKEEGRHAIKRSGFYLTDDTLSAAADTSADGRYSKRLKWQTLDEIEELTHDMQDAVASIATRILNGEAQKTPSEEACRFCAVRASCDRACKSR